MMRAGTSANPPADSGTTILTGRFGYDCAMAFAVAATSATASATVGILMARPPSAQPR